MKVFVFAGSLRAASFNRKLAALAAESARRAGAEAELGDFRDYCPPIYDGDAEAAHGLPPEARALAAKIEAADAIVIASPEYNRSIPGPLKNALDWISRLKPYKLADKPVLMIGATSGKAACANGFAALRITLEFQTAKVYAESYGLNGGATAFTADGRFADTGEAERLDALVKAFVTQ
ncbi:MAG: NADPH-dependent FMN reductase [Alphaproteobacteria bacterium]